MITTKNDSVRLYGLSTDSKPVDGVINGTIFVEIDTSDEYYFNEDAGTWVKKNSSVGGGLPTPTMADNGKAVVVSATATEGAVIVPEQTGEIVNESFVCDDAVVSLFTEGTQVIAYENGNRYECTIEDAGGGLGFNLDETQDSGFYLHEGSIVFFDVTKDEGAEVTVKLVVRGADSIGYGLNFAGMAVTPSSGFLVDDETAAYYFSEGTTLDKTFAEIAEAAKAGCNVNLVAVPADGVPDVDTAMVFRLAGFNGGYDYYAVFFEAIYIDYESAVQYAMLEFGSSTADGVLTYTS